ncbi:MAG TPA: hypothetical protein VM690_02290 [Gaiellaceae bacterium]|nr:hypothetical protein [Gaiellaceae bacterium]
MTSSGLELIPRRSTAKVLRRLLVVGAAVAAAVTTGLFFLGSSGTGGLSISAPAGLPASGNVADVTTMSSNVTRTNGAALLQTGVTIAKINVAESYSAKIRVEISWNNVNNAATLLNNPNTQISIGIYHAIHTGNCVGTAGATTTAPLINLTDTDSNTYCVSLDQTATGSPSVSATGKLLLAKNLIAGNLNPIQDLSGAEIACAANVANDNDVPCQPAGVTDANQRALFVIASLTTPGTVPVGQQASVGSLSFFVRVRRIS